LNELTLAALSIDRRTAALALFNGLCLEDMLLRSLPADQDAAVNTLIGFLNRSIDRYKIEFVGLRSLNDKSSSRIKSLHTAALSVLRNTSLPLEQVDEKNLLESFGHPPLRSRDHLRKVGRNIWPALNDSHATNSAVDAAVLGLHVQVERLLTIHSQQL
jgi:hypothetical protein